MKLLERLLVLSLLGLPGEALAAGREVLLLANSAEGVNFRGRDAIPAVEMVLSHLGLVPRLHDLAGGLPPAELSHRVGGVVTMLEGSGTPQAAEYAAWLAERIGAKQPVVILGGLGFLEDSKRGPLSPEFYAPIFRGLGLQYGTEYEDEPELLEVAHSSAPMGFERPLGTPPFFVQLRSVGPGNEVFFRLRRKDTGETSDMGVLGPGGGIVFGREYLFYSNPLSHLMQWRIDPFAFLERSLKLTGEPRFDPTTINGRRIFYAHIDGDGFANVANRPRRPLASETIRDYVLKRTGLPTTVSVISSEIEGDKREAIARSIFALPNVEAGSHSANHPFDWEKGLATPVGMMDQDDGVFALPRIAGFSPESEIDCSVASIGRLLPPGKRVAAFLWSGKTNPTAPFLARTAQLGLANLNGGDSYLDLGAPSYADFSPLGRWVDGRFQVFNSFTNENLFTNLWTGPFDGQQNLLRSFEFAERPRRIAPVNIYYHFYSGEHVSSLRTLRSLYSWAEKQPLAPVFASRYARIVEAFLSARIESQGPGEWLASSYGSCQTLRFDRESRLPDLEKSQGVAGYHRVRDALYLHLAPGSARIVLEPHPASLPYLEEANAPLSAWSRGPRSLKARFAGVVPLETVWSGFRPGQKVRVTGKSAIADRFGRVSLRALPSEVTLRW